MALVKFLDMKNLDVTVSDNEGKNLFPDKWRKDSVRLAAIEELKLPTTEYTKFGFKATPAAQRLVELLNQDKSFEILATGPLSNIADALALEPKIAKNIKRIYFMGGAIHVHGNVEAEGHDVSAEWNVYNNPKSVSAVLAAGIPLVFVSLDATNKTPVTRKFMKDLGQQDRFPVSRLFHKVWGVIAPQIERDDYQKTYFFWDTLTSAFAANPKIGTLKREKIKIIEDGPSEGRTQPHPNGFSVEVLSEPKPELLHRYILDLFRR
jgi:purine nucleosidase